MAPGVRHTSTVKVRHDHVMAYLDDKLMLDWPIDPTNVRGHDVWKLKDPKQLGLGFHGCDVIVHAAHVIDLPPADAAPEAAP